MQICRISHGNWLFAAILAAQASGCGQSLPPASSAEAARALLTSTLDTWKGGGQPGALASQSPPVHVMDGDWERGAELLGYQLEGDGQRLGLALQYAVALELKDAKGKLLKKKVAYAVNGGATPSVARLDADL